MVVRDEAQRRRLGAVYRKASDIASAMYRARGRPPHVTEEDFQKMMSAGAYLWDHMGDAPVILIPCQTQPVLPPLETLPPEVRDLYAQERHYVERIRGASIYPAVQNIVLACRALGLGTTITTNHIRCEDEVKAILGIPDDVQTFAMMPIGYPQGNSARWSAAPSPMWRAPTGGRSRGWGDACFRSDRAASPSSCPRLSRASTSCFRCFCKARRGWPGQARP